MKKRNLLFALLLTIAMLITACGGNQSVEGKWIGTLDLTKQFEDGIKEAYPDLAEYVAFEELVFTLDISFVEGQMEMQVQQESIDAFNTKFAEGMQSIAEGYWETGLAEIDMTLEEAISESGMTEAAYTEHIYKETGIDKMITSMSQMVSDTLDMLSHMKGTYTTPVKDELRLYYTEDEFESMTYSFKGKQLNLTIKGDSFSLLIQCKRAD